MDYLDRAIEKVEQHGHGHEWIWRLVIDHGYKFNKVEPEINAAFKRWDRLHNKKSKNNYWG